MGNIKIVRGVFDTKLELEHAGVAAGFPSPADDYRHETIDRISRMHGSETIVIGAQQYTQKNGKGKAEVFANAIKHDFRSKNPTTRWSDMLRLLDLYKSCFQDYMGAEHLVSDRQRVMAYLDDELNTTSIDDLMPWNYEPCGIDSNYYRVSIRTIKESVISEDLLLDAFIRSANSKKRPTVDSWRDRWHVIIGTVSA